MGISFKSGYDRIILEYIDESMLPFLLDRVTSSLVGCEVIEQSGTACVIQCLQRDSPSEFWNMVKRMFLILGRMGSITLEIVRDGKYDRSILSLEDSMNRLCNSCHRLINKNTVVQDKV